jgi:hypothetical protein
LPVKIGDRLGQSLAGSTGAVREAASLGELLALVLKRIAARYALELANAGNLAGKTAIMDLIRGTMIELAPLGCSRIYAAFSASRATTGCTQSSY